MWKPDVFIAAFNQTSVTLSRPGPATWQPRLMGGVGCVPPPGGRSSRRFCDSGNQTRPPELRRFRSKNTEGLLCASPLGAPCRQCGVRAGLPRLRPILSGFWGTGREGWPRRGLSVPHLRVSAGVRSQGPAAPLLRGASAASRDAAR